MADARQLELKFWFLHRFEEERMVRASALTDEVIAHGWTVKDLDEVTHELGRRLWPEPKGPCYIALKSRSRKRMFDLKQQTKQQLQAPKFKASLP